MLNPAKRITAEEILREGYFKDVERIVPPGVYERFLGDIVGKSESGSGVMGEGRATMMVVKEGQGEKKEK